MQDQNQDQDFEQNLSSLVQELVADKLSFPLSYDSDAETEKRAFSEYIEQQNNNTEEERVVFTSDKKFTFVEKKRKLDSEARQKRTEDKLKRTEEKIKKAEKKAEEKQKRDEEKAAAAALAPPKAKKRAFEFPFATGFSTYRNFSARIEEAEDGTFKITGANFDTGGSHCYTLHGGHFWVGLSNEVSNRLADFDLYRSKDGHQSFETLQIHTTPGFVFFRLNGPPEC